MDRPLIKQGWLRVILYLFALIFTMILFGILAFLLFPAISGKIPEEFNLTEKGNINRLIIYQGIILTGVTLLTLLFRKGIDRQDIVTLGFQMFHVKRDLLLGIFIGFGCIAAGFLILYVSGYVYIERLSADTSYLAGSLIFFFMVSWIEEISFRGYILNNLMDSFHPHIALLLSSTLFALFHVFNNDLSLLAFTNLILAGILLGIIFIYTRTIWFALSLHFSWNFFQGPVFGFRVSGIETPAFMKIRTEGADFISGGDFGFEGSLLCSFLIILSILLLYRYNKRIN